MTRIVLLGIAAVLLLDTLGSLASNAMGFRYSLLSFVSVIIYTATGMAVARSVATDKVRQAWHAGLLVGLVDATLGWGISWIVGPGRVDPAELGGAVGVAFSAGFTTFLVSLFALAGGWFESRQERS